MSGSGKTEVVPLTRADLFLEKLEELKQKLQAAAPGYEHLLHDIHRTLQADEQLLHMLTDEQIGIILAGMSKRTNIVIADLKSTPGAKEKSKLKNVTAEEL